MTPSLTTDFRGRSSRRSVSATSEIYGHEQFSAATGTLRYLGQPGRVNQSVTGTGTVDER